MTSQSWFICRRESNKNFWEYDYRLAFLGGIFCRPLNLCQILLVLWLSGSIHYHKIQVHFICSAWLSLNKKKTCLEKVALNRTPTHQAALLEITKRTAAVIFKKIYEKQASKCSSLQLCKVIWKSII